MKLTNYIKKLHLSTYMWILNADSEIEIYSSKILKNEDNLEENIIYVGYVSDFELKSNDKKLSILLINNISKPITKEELFDSYPNCNIITTNHEISINIIFEKASQIFFEEAKYTSRINRMLFAFNLGKGLQHLVDVAYQITGNPIIVIDSSYKILAMYSDFDSGVNEVLENQRVLGYLSDYNLERMKRDKIYEKMRSVQSPMYEKASDDTHAWINALVYIHDIEVAQIGMMEYKGNFDDYDLEFIKFFSQIISWEMQKNTFYINKHSVMHSIFLSELLENKIPNQKIANFRKKQLNWNSSSNMNVLTLFTNYESTYEINFERKAEIMAIHIRHLFPDSRWVIYKSRLVILITNNSNSIEKFMPKSKLYECLKTNNFLGAVSNTFSDLLDIKKYYEQTISIIELRNMIKKEQIIYIYSEYMFYHIASLISDKNKLEDFYHPAIIKMKAYDKKNNTNYINTIIQYLTNVDNPTLCAENLFIHKNTFFYRMNKIREIFEINLNNGMERLKVQLTLEFMKID